MRLFIFIYLIVFLTINVNGEDREKSISRHLMPLTTVEVELESTPNTGSGLMGSLPLHSIYQMCEFFKKKYKAEKNDDEIWQKLIKSEKYSKDLILFYFLFISENSNESRLSEIKDITINGLKIVDSYLKEDSKVVREKVEFIKRYILISNSQKFDDDLIFQFNFVVRNLIHVDSDFVLYELFNTNEYIAISSYYCFAFYSKFKKKISFDELNKGKKFNMEIMLKKLNSIQFNKTDIDDCFNMNYILDFFGIKDKVKEVPKSDLFDLAKPLEPDFDKLFSLEIIDKELIYYHENYLVGIVHHKYREIPSDRVLAIALKTSSSSIFSNCINLIKYNYGQLSEESINKLRAKNLDDIEWSERLGDKKIYFSELIDQLEKSYKIKRN